MLNVRKGNTNVV